MNGCIEKSSNDQAAAPLLVDDWPLHRLATAVLARAVKDAIHPTLVTKHEKDLVQAHARLWLKGEESSIYTEVCGYPREKLIAWAESGCPAPDPEDLKTVAGGHDDLSTAIARILRAPRSIIRS